MCLMETFGPIQEMSWWTVPGEASTNPISQSGDTFAREAMACIVHRPTPVGPIVLLSGRSGDPSTKTRIGCRIRGHLPFSVEV